MAVVACADPRRTEGESAPARDAALLPQLEAGAVTELAPQVEADAGAGARAVLPATTAAVGAASSAPPPAQPSPAVAPASPPVETCLGRPEDDAFVADPRMCLRVFASELQSPRQMAFASNGDLFVNEGTLTVLWDEDQDGISGGDERATFSSEAPFEHGVAFDRDQSFIYAAGGDAIYRWPYRAGQREAEQPAAIAVRGVPRGGHSSRTLVFDSQGRLYVSVGSVSNVDTSEELWATRAQVRRFDLSDVPDGGVDYSDGELVATGMRNEVGLYVDAADQLWGVENGRDELSDDELGGDIHADNPGEEINLVDGQGTNFYGYPFCFSEFRVHDGGGGPGTQWADQTLDADVRKTDAWCKDPSNVRPPVFSMQAHYAPLGIVQYTGQALPFNGDFIITAHGSWNRSPAVGRLLLRAHHDGGNITAVEPIVGAKDGSGGVQEGGWDARPVDVQQGPDQALYVSDDSGGRVFKLGYRR